MRYEIKQGQAGQSDFTFYGGARDFARYKGSEAIVHGPAETGKTISALFKLHIVACKYPGCSLVIARKTLTSTYGTVLQTFKDKVLGDAPVRIYGGEKPQFYDYTNGSRIWVAGMDKSSKILSSEHDIIYVNQAEELVKDDWETLTTRTTGRAGNMPYSQTIGDANPAWPSHWMYHRPTLRMFYSKHRENPALFDQETGQITSQGERTMSVLNALTGVRKERLLHGKPTMAEGAIYTEYDEATHRVYTEDTPEFVRYIGAIDWGYRNPGCLGVFGLTGDDGMYLVAQHYHTLKRDDWWLGRAKELQEQYGVEAWACDPSEPAYIDKFRAAGLRAVKAFNGVLPGINAVKERLDNGRLFFIRDSLLIVDRALKDEEKPCQIEDEFAGYVWADKKSKEAPVKEWDHGMDMIRYATAYIDGLGRDAGFDYFFA